MQAIEQSRLKVKIFVGYPVGIELHQQLKLSKEWKQACIVKAKEGGHLELVQLEDQLYIGSYLTTELSPVAVVKQTAANVVERLHSYVPEADLDAQKIRILPQIFVS